MRASPAAEGKQHRTKPTFRFCSFLPHALGVLRIYFMNTGIYIYIPKLKNERPDFACGALRACGEETFQVAERLEVARNGDAQHAVLAAEDILRIRDANKIQL